MSTTQTRSSAGLEVADSPRVRRDGRWDAYRLGRGTLSLLAIPLVFIVITLGVPMLFVVLTAFGPGDATFGGVLADPLFGQALARTLWLAATICAICTVLGVAYALGIVLAPRWLSATMLITLGATFFVSLMVRTYGWVILFQPRGLLYKIGDGLGLVDAPLEILQTQPAMYIGMVHIMLPFSVLLTYSSLSSMDANLIKAARSMGAGSWQTFRQVVLPEIRGGVIAGALLVFMVSLAFYVTPAILGGPTQLTMGTLIGREMNVKYDFKSAAMIGILLTVVVMVLYLISERVFKITKQWERQ